MIVASDDSHVMTVLARPYRGGEEGKAAWRKEQTHALILHAAGEMHNSYELHVLIDKRGNYKQLRRRKAGSEIE